MLQNISVTFMYLFSINYTLYNKQILDVIYICLIGSFTQVEIKEFIKTN